MLAILIDSRIAMDEGTIRMVPSSAPCFFHNGAGWQSDDGRRFVTVAEIVRTLSRAGGNCKVALAVFWNQEDDDLDRLLRELAADQVIPEKLFLLLASPDGQPVTTATKPLERVVASYQAASEGDGQIRTAAKSNQFLVTFLGSHDFRRDSISADVRLAVIESLVMVLRRGGEIAFARLMACSGPKPVRVIGLRSWMPALRDVHRAILARLGRLLHAEYQNQNHGQTSLVPGHTAISQIEVLEKSLIGVFDQGQDWPARLELFAVDWKPPLWRKEWRSQMTAVQSDKAHQLAAHADLLKSSLKDFATQARVLSQRLVADRISQSRQFVENQNHLGALAELLLEYFPEFSKAASKLPRGASAPITPAGSPSPQEVADRTNARDPLDKAASHETGLLSLATLIGLAFILAMALGASYSLWYYCDVAWYWLLLGPVIWAFAAAIRVWQFVKSRRAIHSIVIGHVNSVEGWLRGQYAGKLERVRQNARRLALLQFLVHQETVGARLDSLLQSLVGDWRRMLERHDGPELPTLGFESDAGFQEAERALGREFANLPETIVRIAFDSDHLGSEAGLLDKIVARMLARLFQAQSVTVIPVAEIEDAVRGVVDRAATPEPLAWLGSASPHSPIDKVLILPDQKEYRELGLAIVKSRPAVNAFELYEASCPVSAPTVIRFGPPMFPADIPQVQSP